MWFIDILHLFKDFWENIYWLILSLYLSSQLIKFQNNFKIHILGGIQIRREVCCFSNATYPFQNIKTFVALATQSMCELQDNLTMITPKYLVLQFLACLPSYLSVFYSSIALSSCHSKLGHFCDSTAMSCLMLQRMRLKVLMVCVFLATTRVVSSTYINTWLKSFIVFWKIVCEEAKHYRPEHWPLWCTSMYWK